MLRSEEMTTCDMYVQAEAAFENLTLLGEMECVQFIDMNPNMSPLDRHFVTDLCRCADLERSLIMIRDEILKDKIKIWRLRDLSEIKPLHPRDLFDFENMLDTVAKDVKDMTANHTNLIKLKSETKEIYYVLNHLDPILGDVETGYNKLPKAILPSSTSPYERRQLKIITGVIERSINYHFRTMLWRISLGTIFYKEASNDEEFPNPVTGRNVRKVAFVIVCHGEELQERIMKVCTGFNANLYRWPETHEDRVSTINELAKRMVEMDKVLQRTKLQRAATFRSIAQQWEAWMTQVRKAKTIYFNMNLFNFDITSNTLIGLCWLADRNFSKVENALEQSSALVGTRSFMVRSYTEITPPTSYRTTRFTRAFQQVICSYDTGRYMEINPGVFSVILFPFLFAVMFGDVGHGVLLFVYGAWMINNENKYLPRRSTNDVWNLIFAGRYMILMMGCFSMFMGVMYNEWFSLCTKMMAPYWLNTYDIAANIGRMPPAIQLQAGGDTGFVYKYGIDPGIKLSESGVQSQNSVKMKLAVILGVLHMTLGLVLSIFNMLYFKKIYAIFCHTVPRMLFILCIYGYLCFLIFHKWIIAFTGKENDKRHLWPTLRHEFLDLVLWRNLGMTIIRSEYFKTEFSRPYTETPLYREALRAYESHVRRKAILYHIALASFPIMLLASPIYLLVQHSLQLKRLEASGQYGECQLLEFKKQKAAELQGIMVHRVVRTMEYGLAIISHMASYLRLWALSMAHSCLSRVLWDITMRNLALKECSKQGIWKILITFPLWAMSTVFFLIFMDSLAMFVHVLRLHWIEFMTKFFKGGGIPFLPFSLVTVLDDLDSKYEDDQVQALCKIRRARTSAGDF